MKQFGKKSCVLFLLIMCTIFSCKSNYDRQTVIKMLASSDPDSVLQACSFIVDSEDTTYTDFLLKRPYQCKISFNLKYKGMNGYQGKMQALESLSKTKSPLKIDYKCDTTIAVFYRKVLNR